MLPPASEYGVTVPQILEIPTAGAYLTKTNPNVEASLKWIDAQMETEMMMTASNGKMGEQMIINDEGKYEIINVPENNGLYDFVPVTMGQFFAPGEYYSAIYQMAPQRVERYEDSQWYAQADVLEKISYQYLTDLSKMSNEDATELNLIRTELEKYQDKHGVRFNCGIHKVEAVDTTAAGDTFTGFFLSEILRHGDAEKALRTASVAAGIAVSRKGAEPSIPSMSEVEAIL